MTKSNPDWLFAIARAEATERAIQERADRARRLFYHRLRWTLLAAALLAACGAGVLIGKVMP